MRYKQNLAKYFHVADAARLIAQRAGIPEGQARVDLVHALQDYAVRCLLYDVRKDGRHLRRNNGDVVRQLNPDRIDWGRSQMRGGSVYVNFTVEIEVSRDDIGRLWPDKSITAPDGADKPETPQRPGRPSAPEASIKEAFEKLIESEQANLETITANYEPIRAMVKGKLDLKSPDEAKGLGDETIRKIIKPLIEKAKNGGNSAHKFAHKL